MGESEFLTERLILRHWRDDDAESLYEYARDPRIGPPAGWAPHRSVEDSREIIRSVLSAPETYAVCLREDGRAIGSIGLRMPGHSTCEIGTSEVEIGYWIGVPFWGRGLIPEAVRRLQRHAFEDMGCTGMWCGYYDGNEKSRRAQEKCGFTYRQTIEGMECPALGETRTGHFTFLPRERWAEMCAPGEKRT